MALLFLGLLIKPWTLVLVLVVAFGGPLVGSLQGLAASPVSHWRRSHWLGLALLLSAVLLALTGSSGGQGALVLALLPVAWVLVTDRSILQGSNENERTSRGEPLTLSRAADVDGSSAQPEARHDREAAAAGPPERLIGSKLLAKIKELGDVGKSDLVRACGYVSQKPDGSERLNFTAFYEALLEAKGIEASNSNPDDEVEEEATVNFDALWNYFQEGGGDIWNEDETVYLGTFEGDPGTYIIEVNGPDEYEVPYCTGREDLPRIVEAFVDNGGAISDLLKAVSPSSTKPGNTALPEGWDDLGSTEVVERLKTSTDVSAEILRALSGSDDWEVRQAVAWHDNTPVDAVEALAEDDDSDVRRATQERSLPMEWRTKSQDEKVSALQSADITLDIIQGLSASEDWSIRQAVAWSPSTPESILTTLKEDRDDDVKAAATEERKLSVEWRFLGDWEKVERLQAETLSPEILTILSKSRASDVRRAVALNACTPETVLAQLSQDDDKSVQSGVRERQLPNAWKARDDDERIESLKEEAVPEDVLSILAQSGDWRIRQAVALSPATSASILERLFRDDDTDVQSAVRERNLPEDWKQLDSDEKVEKLNESSAAQDVLKILSKSGNWEIRRAVAANAAASEELLKELIKDEDDDVKRAAKKSLRRMGAGSSTADTQVGEDDEEHSIYIKTEPGGSIRFGTLNADQIEALQNCIEAQELTDDLREIGDNSSGELNECEGVVNSGDEGDFGNEGTIVYSADQPALGPDYNDDDSFKDGVYVVMMRLSKCSISFEFMASGGFDEDEFEEVSVPVRLPEEIVHGLYGHPEFNIITGFRFRGEPVEEYDGEVEDRGYDDQLTFFAIKGGEVTVLYSNFNGEEEWCDPEEAQDAIQQ